MPGSIFIDHWDRLAQMAAMRSVVSSIRALKGPSVVMLGTMVPQATALLGENGAPKGVELMWGLSSERLRSYRESGTPVYYIKDALNYSKVVLGMDPAAAGATELPPPAKVIEGP